MRKRLCLQCNHDGERKKGLSQMEKIMQQDNSSAGGSKTQHARSRFAQSNKDLVMLGMFVMVVFVLSFYFNFFKFIVISFQKNIIALEWIDEIIMCLLTLSIGLAVYAWRRMMELKKETEKCIAAEKEVAQTAITRAETEKIITKQLHAEIEVLLKYLKEDRQVMLSKIQKSR